MSRRVFDREFWALGGRLAAASGVRVVRSAAVNSSFEKFSGNSGSG